MRRKGEAQKRLWDSKKKPQSQRMAFLLAASSLDVLGRLSFQKQKQHEHTGKCFEKNSQAASLPPKANAAIKKKSSSFHIEQRANEQRELTASTWKWEWEQREREGEIRKEINLCVNIQTTAGEHCQHEKVLKLGDTEGSKNRRRSKGEKYSGMRICVCTSKMKNQHKGNRRLTSIVR